MGSFSRYWSLSLVVGGVRIHARILRYAPLHWSSLRKCITWVLAKGPRYLYNSRVQNSRKTPSRRLPWTARAEGLRTS